MQAPQQWWQTFCRDTAESGNGCTMDEADCAKVLKPDKADGIKLHNDTHAEKPEI